MIVAEGLAKEFGGRVAVESLDLEVGAGEIFGLLGPNGAGKTTSVRMLAALVAPTRGRARIAGHELGRESSAVRAAIGVLTETPGVYPRLTALENLVLFARLHDVEDPQRAALRYLDLVGLADRRDDLAGTFSKGMRQKLAIARALVHEPRVLFFDEPTSALDPASAKVVRDAIGAMRDEKRAVILCTHNLDEADQLADRIGIFRQKLLRTGTPASLRRALYGRRSLVRLHAVTDAIVAAVQALPLVRAVERVETTALRIEVDDPEHDHPHVVRALVAAGADVVSLNEEHASLEQVYLDLVGPVTHDA